MTIAILSLWSLISWHSRPPLATPREVAHSSQVRLCSGRASFAVWAAAWNIADKVLFITRATVLFLVAAILEGFCADSGTTSALVYVVTAFAHVG